MVAAKSQVDINTADAATLALALDGVGMTKAQDIVAHREQFGAFSSIDDLEEVRGIGPATVARNRDKILIVAKE
jgi:competence protein ComEA